MRVLADPHVATRAAVTEAGYPPRPAPGSARYDLWLRLVSSSPTRIDAHTIETQLQRGPATGVASTNWAGIALNYPALPWHIYSPYTDIGSWSVIPTFSSSHPNGSRASLWIGLGGYYDSAIIQEGIDGRNSSSGVTTYKPWIQYFPGPLTEVNFNMSPGDVVYWEVMECDANWNYGPGSHGYGCFFWWDLTKNTFYSDIRPLPSGSSFMGYTCEVVVERVWDCVFVQCPLSSWSGLITQPFTCWDGGLTADWDLSSDPYLSITLQNTSGQNLALPGVVNPNSATIDWVLGN